MICYLDSSVVLRKVFGEPHPLKEWKKIRVSFSSRLLQVECLRTIDRAQFHKKLPDSLVSERLSLLHDVFKCIGEFPITEDVLLRAGNPLPVTLGTLDAIHLATALLWREQQKTDFYFATHDEQLAGAARAYGFKVLGV